MYMTMPLISNTTVLRAFWGSASCVTIRNLAQIKSPFFFLRVNWIFLDKFGRVLMQRFRWVPHMPRALQSSEQLFKFDKSTFEDAQKFYVCVNSGLCI